MRASFFLAVALAAPACSPCSLDDPPIVRQSFDVVVTDAAAAPIENAAITATDDNGANVSCTSTDFRGHADCSDTSVGAFTVFVTKAGFQPATLHGTAPPASDGCGPATQHLEVVLQPAQ